MACMALKEPLHRRVFALPSWGILEWFKVFSPCRKVVP